MTIRHADVVVVGGGAVGCAVAYFLAAESAFGGSVVVVERDPGYQYCSTGRSVGSIRLQFSTPENILMSRFGVEFLSRFGEYLAVDDEPPEPSFVRRGYLFLATRAGAEALADNCRTQWRHGARTVLLEPAELTARFPWLNTDGIARGAYGGCREGWFDPHSVLMALRRKARSLGVEFRTGEVSSFDTRSRRVHAVRMRDGGRLACGAVVNAAGPAAAHVARLAGIAIPVEPRKRCVFVIDCRTPLAGFPMLIDPSGTYVRPEGDYYLCGVSPAPEDDPVATDYAVEHALFEDKIWPVLARRVPAFEAVKVVNAWAGHYAYNRFDQNALLGAHADCENLYLANGFSGHGLQQAPAVGRALSELITFGGYRTLDLTRLSPQRLTQGEPLREQHIV